MEYLSSVKGKNPKDRKDVEVVGLTSGSITSNSRKIPHMFHVG